MLGEPFFYEEKNPPRNDLPTSRRPGRSRTCLPAVGWRRTLTPVWTATAGTAWCSSTWPARKESGQTPLWTDIKKKKLVIAKTASSAAEHLETSPAGVRTVAVLLHPHPRRRHRHRHKQQQPPRHQGGHGCCLFFLVASRVVGLVV